MEGNLFCSKFTILNVNIQKHPPGGHIKLTMTGRRNKDVEMEIILGSRKNDGYFGNINVFYG